MRKTPIKSAKVLYYPFFAEKMKKGPLPQIADSYKNECLIEEYYNKHECIYISLR